MTPMTASPTTLTGKTRVSSASRRAPPAAVELRPADARGRGRRLAAAALGGTVVAVFVGGLAGLLLGFVAAIVIERLLCRVTPRAVVARREALVADLPFAADLLAACLRAGRSPVQSIEAIAAELRGPLGEELALVAAGLRLGGDAATVWSGFLDEQVLAPFGRAMVRVWDSGASLAETLERLADDARRARRAAADRRARAVGVKAAAPLGLCFLPAFVLVGVVPLVAAAAAGLVG